MPAQEDEHPDAANIVDLPVLKFGYRSTRASWSELKAIVASGELARLSRSRDQQIEYEIHKQGVLNVWRSLTDYILCEKFELEALIDDKDFGRRYANLPSPTDRVIRKTLLRNDFPYFMEGHIEHWILWKLGDQCTEQDRQDAERELSNRYGDVQDCIHWVNPPQLQSLPDIEHIHILLLRAGSVE